MGSPAPKVAQSQPSRAGLLLPEPAEGGSSGSSCSLSSFPLKAGTWRSFLPESSSLVTAHWKLSDFLSHTPSGLRHLPVPLSPRAMSPAVGWGCPGSWSSQKSIPCGDAELGMRQFTNCPQPGGELRPGVLLGGRDKGGTRDNRGGHREPGGSPGRSGFAPVPAWASPGCAPRMEPPLQGSEPALGLGGCRITSRFPRINGDFGSGVISPVS